MSRLKRFSELFRYREDIQLQSTKFTCRILNFNIKLILYNFYLNFSFFKIKIIYQVSVQSTTKLKKCPQGLHGPMFFANIFVKRKKFAKPFLPVYMGPR